MSSNISLENQAFCMAMSLYKTNHSIRQPWHTLFTILYSMVSFFSFFSNLLLLISLYHYRKKLPKSHQNAYSHFRITQGRTLKHSEKTRDYLVAYLACLDLLLSLTMPFTAIDLLTKYWPFGPKTEVLARLTRIAPEAIIQASSMIIILIANHCYRQILLPSKKQLTPSKIKYLVLIITVISISYSMPICYFTHLKPLLSKELGDKYNLPIGSSPNIDDAVSSQQSFFNITTMRSSIPMQNGLQCHGIDSLDLSDIIFCIDEWPILNNGKIRSRLYYSLASFLMRLVIPFIVICRAYMSIYRRLKQQIKIQKRVYQKEVKLIKEKNRNKRRNKLLILISFHFLLAWLPLTLFGTLSDANINIFGYNGETNTIVFMSFHLIGMLSACANPIIYGYRNKHLRRETVRLFRIIFKGPISVVSLIRNSFLHLSNPKPESILIERKISLQIDKTHKMEFVDKQSPIKRRHSCPVITSMKQDNGFKMISYPLSGISVANLKMQPRLNPRKTRSISL